MKLTIPTIHLNGTSKASLLEAISDAYNALNEAEKKLCETAPNGRDYYVQSPQAINDAQDEHYVRLGKLRSVKEELQQLAEAIDAQRR